MLLIIGVRLVNVLEDGLQKGVLEVKLLNDLRLGVCILRCYAERIVYQDFIENLDASQSGLVLLDVLNAEQHELHPVLFESPIPHDFTEPVQRELTQLIAVDLLLVHQNFSEQVSRF